MKRIAVVAFVALATSTSGCWRACGAHTEKKLRGKVAVELVAASTFTGGNFGTSHALVVHASPEFKVPVACDDADLAENDTGTLIAWRCKDATTWQLVRISGARHVIDCDAPEVGTTAKPDFAAAKSIKDAASRITKCALDEPWIDTQEQIDAFDNVVAELSTPIEVAHLFRDSIKIAAKNADRDPWSAAVAKIAAPARAELELEVCSMLAAPTDKTGYVHAARICPYDSAAGEAAASLLKAATPGPVDARTQWAALIAATEHPKDAAAIACSTFATDAGAPLAIWLATATLAKPGDVRVASFPACN